GRAAAFARFFRRGSPTACTSAGFGTGFGTSARAGGSGGSSRGSRLRARVIGRGSSSTACEHECNDGERQDDPGARRPRRPRHETLSASSLCHVNPSDGKKPFHSTDSPSALSSVLVASKLDALNVALSVSLLIRPPADPVTWAQTPQIGQKKPP